MRRLQLTISPTRKFAGVAAAAGLLIALAGCGSAPAATPTTADPSNSAVAGFKPCIVSDDGGWNDKSFNQSAKEGMDKAASALGVKAIEVESTNSNEYASNLESLVSQSCTYIISVGFKLSADTITSALANPAINYAIIDDFADNTGAKDAAGKDIGDGKTDAPNIKPLVFDTAQAAYLGGYAAAAWSAESKVNKVGTVGGVPIPSVKIFMDGYQLGVEKYNKDKSANVELVGWDMAKPQSGSFTGGFAANDAAKQAMQAVLDQGVDVLLPVGGPIYQSARDAIADSGSKAVILGVDSDLAVKDTTVAAITLVSIQKAIDQAVYDSVLSAASGKFDVTPYVGTLENKGVSLSSFHDFESKLPAGLTDELAKLQEQIIKGDITVKSENSP